MSGAQWCLSKGISRHAFNSAIKRLRKSSYEIPSREPHEIHDLTSSRQDVVKVDIVPDVQLPEAQMSTAAPHFDNSHMIR